MIHNLRKRLILLYFLSTGLILTAVVITALFSSISQTKQQNKIFLMNITQSLTYIIENNTVIHSSQLAQYELDAHVLIQITDQNIPLSFSGAWEPVTDRYVLFDRLEALNSMAEITSPDSSLTNDSGVLQTNSAYTIKGDHGDEYYGSVTRLQNDDRNIEIYIVYYVDTSAWLNFVYLWPYLLMELSGLLILWVLSGFLVRKSLNPVELSIDKQKSFIASASHELKAPLAVIQTSASAVITAPEKAESLLTAIQKECSRMGRLIQDMLSLAASDDHSWTIHLVPLDITSLLIETYERYESLCIKQGLTLALQFPDDGWLPKINGDKERLIQVVSILIDNAAAYSFSGSEILIKAYADNGFLYLEIIDHGKGISDKEKNLVFDRFYQGDEAHSDKKHFGLGLSIAHSIIEGHGGSIRICDTTGGGSTFQIRIPK